MCDKDFTWNPSNCECDKSCNIGHYLDYENCKCRKRLIDKLVNECTETVEEEVEIVSESKNKCNSCILYIVLFSIFFTINVSGIATYYVYSQWYLKKYSRHVDLNTHKETMI